MDNNLYRQELLDHYRHPRNYGVLSHAHMSTEILNPSCGDQISLQIAVVDDRLDQVRFQGKGCVISLAAASLLTECVLHKPLDLLEVFSKEDMVDLVGIPLGPTRLRCALLALEALHRAIALYRASVGSQET